MELEQWLLVYQAITTTASAKERNYWMSTGVFLIANFLLLLLLAFFARTYVTSLERCFGTALGAIGILVSIFWLVTQRWTAREISLWESFLRGIEGQFAGSEFHRSIHKLVRGEQVCVPDTSWKCNQWYPDVWRLSRGGRLSPQVLIAFLSVIFLLGWVALVVIANLFASKGALV